MIISQLLGGLGNQMFQYAAGLALAESRRTVLKLDPSWFKERSEYEAHNRYALSCWNITEQFATLEEIRRLRGVQLTTSERCMRSLARLLRLNQHLQRDESIGQVYASTHGDDSPLLHQQPDHTYLEGMYQSESYFAPVADLLRSHFTLRYPLQPNTQAWQEKITSGPSIAVHFRRGDYLRNPTFAKEIGALGMDYYEQAVALLQKKNPHATLFVFSDDIEGVAAEYKPPGPHHFVRGIKPIHAHEKMHLMSLCDDIVVANSTFAWWAAWLNASTSKTVVAPDPWFKDRPAHSSQLVPDTWIKIAR